jgi:hypothetical protein
MPMLAFFHRLSSFFATENRYSSINNNGAGRIYFRNQPNAYTFGV